MSERITAAEVRMLAYRDAFAGFTAVGSALRHPDPWLTRLADQLDADEQRLAEVEAERDDFADRLTVAQEEAEPLRADAEQWRAFVAVRDHKMRRKDYGFGWSQNGGVWCQPLPAPQADLTAPDFPALLKKLDALAEAAKPKPECRTEMEVHLTAALPAIRRQVIGGCIEVVKRVRTNEENRHLSEDRDRRMVPALVDAAHHCGEAVEVALRALLDTGDAGTEKGETHG